MICPQIVRAYPQKGSGFVVILENVGKKCDKCDKQPMNQCFMLDSLTSGVVHGFVA